jgi:hypothetical protein
MPKIIDPSIRPCNISNRRVRFLNVEIDQIFYADGKWWVKISSRAAALAESDEDESRVRFRGQKMCRIITGGLL